MDQPKDEIVKQFERGRSDRTLADRGRFDAARITPSQGAAAPLDRDHAGTAAVRTLAANRRKRASRPAISRGGFRSSPRRDRLAGFPPAPAQHLFLEAARAQQAGRLKDAQKLCLELLKLDVQHAEGLHLLGLVLYADARPEVAVGMFKRAIDADPTEPAFFSNYGNALHAVGKHDEAIAAYTQAIELKPGFADAFYNRANTLRDQGRLEDALADYQKALTLQPAFAEAHCNMGGVLRNLGRLAEAEKHLREGLRLKPDYADATNNLAVTLQDAGRLGEAMACFERSVELMPGNYDVRYNKAMAHLLAGDFNRGWREQEVRWQISSSPRKMPGPQWMGESLRGQRVLLHHECGFGDTLQFLRYAPLVAARGASVLLDVPANLVRLAQLIPGVTEVIATGSPLPAFDLHCPMMSLPLAFDTVLDTIPSATPYLRIPEEACARAAAFDWPAKGMRVGIVWSGNPNFTRDRFRSISLQQLRPLLDVSDVRFFSLQVGAAQTQLETLLADVAAPRVRDLTPAITDMADTAALIAHLDLVITVDTSVAHLAGALDRPVWVMIPAAPDWRWLTERRDTPWYRSMRLFRQDQLGDWEPVVERLRSSLTCSVQRAAKLMARGC